MKRLLICLIIFLQLQQLHAQSVGIGTTTPNSKAALDISSTTQGVLIPRMTTSERNAIIFPPDGLLIFNTSTKMLNQRQDGFWKAMINNYSWEGGGTGQMFNVGDNVGLNIPSPTERLDVDGNIRSNSAMIIDNTSALMLFKSGGVNKGFVQLNGDNLRFGTNSGNTNGETILRMDGTDMVNFKKTGSNGTFIQMNLNGASTGVLQTTSAGNVSLTAVNNDKQVQLGGEVFINNTANRTGIGTSSPEERLHVNGNTKISGTMDIGSNMNVSGEVNRPSTGNYNLLPVCYGRVQNSGNLLGGTPNITNTEFSGIWLFYTVDCPAITTSSIVQITLAGQYAVTTIPIVMVSNGHFEVKFFQGFGETDFYNPGTLGTQVSFQFIVYNP